MAAIVIGLIIFFIYSIAGGKKKKKTVNKVYASVKIPQKAPIDTKRFIKTVKVEMNSLNSNNSIIDVTGKSYAIPQSNFNLKKYDAPIPFWSHHYVYSYEEILSASTEQKIFYQSFKALFLKGEFLDIEGNSNYAFILLFDLINDYVNHRNIVLVEQQLEDLGACYPRTKAYTLSSLIKKLRQIGDIEVISQLKNQQGATNINNQLNGYYQFEWGLGTRYKAKINLKETDVKLLNKLIDTNNKFNSIDYCAVEIIKMFLHTVHTVSKIFTDQNSSFQDQVNIIASIEATKHYKYKNGSYNYKSVYDNYVNTIYQTIYKICENRLRDYFNVGRKADLNYYIHSELALTEFKNIFLIHIEEMLDKEITKLPITDDVTEIALNDYNRARWKNVIDKLEFDFMENQNESEIEKNIQAYILSTYRLVNFNKLNPSVENILFRACKFVSEYHKVEALKFYVEYISYDLGSEKFDNRQLPKTVQKRLFKDDEQQREFQSLIEEFIQSKNKENALAAASSFYIPKRKKIQLDKTLIKQADEKYSNTVELLNEYLQDKEEYQTDQVIETPVIPILEANTESDQESNLLNSFDFNANQLALLELFSKNSYVISQQQLNELAKSKGVFKGQLIESINEACYESLDDLLIEEDDEHYTINENYYQQILSK